MVTISIIALLAALLLPALGMARESARRVQCVDHQREVGIALHNHHISKRSLPTGWKFDSSSQSAFGWAVPALSYLGEVSLSEQIDCVRPLGDPRHDPARETVLEVMLCPSDITEPTFMLYEAKEEGGDELPSLRQTANVPAELMRLPTANYVGVFGTLEPDDEIPAPVGDGAFLENRSVRFREFQRGLSDTIIVGERTMAQVPSTWFGVALAGEDAAARLVGATLEGINNPLADECDFSSRHPGGANFLFGDGHVRFISESIDLWEYHRLARLRQP
jgi:prepilin-type processing-associated H-X9-DG protein